MHQQRIIVKSIISTPPNTNMPLSAEIPHNVMTANATPPILPPQRTLRNLGASSSAEIPFVEMVANTEVMGSTRVTKEIIVTMTKKTMRAMLNGKRCRMPITVDSKPCV